MRILRGEDHRSMPWKNGGGETIEIAVSPAGADLASFGWRVSTARVASDGPFSIFPGVDRSLALLEGDLDLDIGGLGRHRLTAASDPLVFPADVPVEARLVQGAVADLNVMTRRGVCRHQLERRQIAGGVTIEFTADWTFLIPMAACHLIAKGLDSRLRKGDVALGEGAEGGATVTAETALTLFVVTINALA